MRAPASDATGTLSLVAPSKESRSGYSGRSVLRTYAVQAASACEWKLPAVR